MLRSNRSGFYSNFYHYGQESVGRIVFLTCHLCNYVMCWWFVEIDVSLPSGQGIYSSIRFCCVGSAINKVRLRTLQCFISRQ